jgi:asparagine synthase (glutamine-hydrolysing)
MKAIGALLKTRTLDAAGIDAYFSNGYVPSPLCIYREVRKLEASNFITVTTKSFRKVRYWKITAPEKQDATDESVQSLLEDSIRLRFVSDVPVGLLLSGGIDSSLITALAAGRLGKDFKSFSMAGGSGEYDERQYAAMVARNYGVELFTGAVEGDLRSHVERTAHYLDEPFADYSAIPTFLVSSLVSRHVKVAVSGEGGDELFGGYDKYVRWLKIKTFRKVPYTLRRILSAPGFKINEYKPSLLRSVVRLARHSINDDVGSFEAISSTQSPFLKEFSSKFNPEFAERFRSLDDMGLADFSLSKIMDIDRRSYLAEDLLFKVDRMSMANSLEIRCPFLDHRLVELSLRVKEGDMIKGNTNKIILRRLASRLLPSEIARRPKRGFSVPAGDWLKDQLEPMFREYVKKNDILSAIFDYKEIERLFEMHKRGSIELGNKLWAVFAFHLWWGYYGRGAGLEE